MPEDQVPNYRVRLFLSVDLTGSTAFKSKENSFVWLKAFQEFYGEFPKTFVRHYNECCESITGLSPGQKAQVPKIWKTIGDEILFVNRVETVTHLGAYVSAFSKALQAFGDGVQKLNGLDTKGNGWIAAFPSPNCSIQVRTEGGQDPISGLGDLTTEGFEAKVDEQPEMFDFLGSGIDSGFRISRNSTVDTFTISPALAYLLTLAKSNPDATKFDCDLVFHEPQRFKGVVGDRPYPVVSINTVRDGQERKLQQLESSLLKTPFAGQVLVELREYLKTYISLRGIEMPCLKLSDNEPDVELPDHYKAYCGQWEQEKSKALSDLESLEEAGEEDVSPEAQEFLSSDEAIKELKGGDET